jgi:hypothetical protein
MSLYIFFMLRIDNCVLQYNLVSDIRAQANQEGNIEYMAMWAGQGYPLLGQLSTNPQTESAADIVDGLVKDVQDLLK